MAGTFVYTPAAGGVLPPGAHSLSVTFTPTDTADYTTATATVTLSVGKATPTITWATPAAITYGTALSATQLKATSATPGTFTYSPASGTVLKAGSQTLYVTFTPTSTSNYHDATATVTLTVNKATPTITWGTPAAITYGTALSAKQLDATSSVAGTFVYNPASGTVLAPGTHSISVTFTPNDTADYKTATATATLAVDKATPAIHWATPAGIPYGTALSASQLDASSTVPGTFAYSPASGTVLTPGAHTLSVTLTPTNSTDYTDASSTVKLQVGPEIGTQPASQTITVGAKATFSVKATGTATLTYAWQYQSSTTWKSFAAGTGADTATLTTVATTEAFDGLQFRVVVADGNGLTATSSTAKLMVNKATATITWPAPSAITYGTALSATQLDATASTAGTFAYSPASGTVLTAGSHTLSVTFTPTNTADSAITATVTQIVNKATPIVTWATPGAIDYGTALSATQLDAASTKAGSFVYTPASGTVLPPGSHALSATFTPTDAANYNSATATATLAVGKATPTITWATPAAIAYGTGLSSTQLNANSTVSGTFAYSVATGTVLKVGSYSLSVTFTPTNISYYHDATATVTLTVSQATPAITWATPTAITYGTALCAMQFNATSSAAGTFAYSPASGAVLTPGSYTLTASFTPTDNVDFTTAAASVTLAVVKVTPAISWAAPAPIAYGTALSASQLDASSNVAGTFAYTPAAGTLPTAGAQTLSVTFTPTDSTDYSTSTATVGLTTNQATPTISWAAPSAISYGTALSATQLNASSTVPGTFAYTPAAGTVPKSGTQSLSVTFTPTDKTDYTTATATVPLTVNGGVSPAITWAAPAAITYGTALSGTQLDASSNVPGTFAYTPVAGTLLTAGAQTLSVTFTPTDSTDYSTSTATVGLTVNQATPTITWATPSAILLGIALSSAQLDATATIPGSIAYSPSTGTILAVGSQTLSVTFTPTDTTDYTSATKTVTLAVNEATPALSINATSVGFGDVALNTMSTQTVTLTSTGSASVSVNSATVTGTGFTLSGSTFSATLTPGQTATLGVQFDPATVGAATGQLTVTSNSSTNGTVTIPLTGTGTAASYSVDLSWDAPASSTDPVTGYNVYRSPSGSSMYQLLNSSVEAQTAYVDNTVQSGQSYDYIVESVDDSGVASVPTSPIPVTIP